MFFAFFSVLYKTTERSLRSFLFFIKEPCILFGFISHTKIANLAKKECKRTQRSFYKVKKERNVLGSFANKRNVLAFFYVLCKRMLGSLHSFTFFAIECCVLCVLFRSLEKEWKRTELSIGSQVAKNSKKEWKRTLCSLKERKRTECSEEKERSAQP